jgi:hypothetical protein
MLAVGVMPLIAGAMIYFTPVLTRSSTPGRAVLLVPLALLAAGIIAVSGLAWDHRYLPSGAGAALVASIALASWMRSRGRKALGGPHPGLHWYLWALISLAAGLSSILAATFWPPYWSPKYWSALRSFHLHVNTLGLVGLAALGTLQVLIPTVASYHDPQARRRLHRDLKYAVAGSFLVAAGAAWWRPLALVGFLSWSIPLWRFILPLLSEHRTAVWGWHQASTLLAGAALGLALTLLSGALHALGWADSGQALQLFFVAFLFPLVTGAGSYLFPVWIWPGRQGEQYQLAYHRLTLGSAWRALLFALAGVLTLGGLDGAAYLAAAGIAAFLIQLAWALRAKV